MSWQNKWSYIWKVLSQFLNGCLFLYIFPFLMANALRSTTGSGFCFNTVFFLPILRKHDEKYEMSFAILEVCALLGNEEEFRGAIPVLSFVIRLTWFWDFVWNGCMEILRRHPQEILWSNFCSDVTYRCAGPSFLNAERKTLFPKLSIYCVSHSTFGSGAKKVLEIYLL